MCTVRMNYGACCGAVSHVQLICGYAASPHIIHTLSCGCLLLPMRGVLGPTTVVPVYYCNSCLVARVVWSESRCIRVIQLCQLSVLSFLSLSMPERKRRKKPNYAGLFFSPTASLLAKQVRSNPPFSRTSAVPPLVRVKTV